MRARLACAGRWTHTLRESNASKVNAMQTSNRIFDDLARVANGAVSTLVGVKDEIDALVCQRIEKMLVDADLVPRDEFDAVKTMAAEARSEQERLAKRVAALETKLKKLAAKKTGQPKHKATAKPKAAPRRKPSVKTTMSS